jgi:Flp pilus assembly pilin Flp
MRSRTRPVTGLHALAVAALAAAVVTEPVPRLLATTGVAAVLAAAGATLQAPTADRVRLARHAALAGGALVAGGTVALALHAATALVAVLAGATSLGTALATGERPALLERLGSESRGQTLYEYAAVTSLIAVVCVTAVTTIGQITVPWYVISAL